MHHGQIMESYTPLNNYLSNCVIKLHIMLQFQPFDFLNVKVIQVGKKAHLSHRLNLCLWSVTSSIRGTFLHFESTEWLQETLKLSLNRRTLLSPYCSIRNVELCYVVLCRTMQD
jgi:hypothetical protein